ncbi:phosphohydrolase [Candidatus Endobugula sertula]|uniref:Phosphohydrolase n=1 Tax=Candidatus Endobugula sertula TaxID=62101 RepID=A0A1D2QMJ7_9GAMM|nr:phosphohydrolase [Candidatus Endobugula sertula]
MFYLTTNIAALIIYLSAAGYLLTLLVKYQSLQQQWLFFLLSCATVLHGIGIYYQVVTPIGVDLTIVKAISLVIFSINSIVLISSLRKPLHSLFILLLPLSVIGVTLATFFHQHSSLIAPLNFGIGAHVILSIIAYSILAITSLQALLLYWQHNRLKKRQLTEIIKHLPPLQTMETLMFELLLVGVILLSGSVLLGALYIDDMFAQHLAHKTILSIIAWTIFSLLLWGRYQWGWRGNKAIHWTLSGYCILMLAYFGSKLVLEVILA